MRLLTWNINGLRTLPLYHPWNALKTGENILNELNADVICFQETKSSRQALDKSFALPDSYDAFYSFPTVKSGYSGVAVFTKRSSVTPLKAEEGLSGTLQSGLKPPFTEDERVSKSKLLLHEVELIEDEVTKTHMNLSLLDQEGRALMLDFGLFVLINLYCPNETSDERLPYKMNYHLLLAERVRKLIEVEKREVIVTGDINICAEPIDHCDGRLASYREEFWVHPARKWFHEWLHPRGPMIDVVRNEWPDREGMYTCWNQKISARATNYGTRIDYFLLTEGLLPWFKHGDIQPSVKGSDHCPVFIDLHDEIVGANNEKIFLRDVLGMAEQSREPPRIATKFWREFAGKQKLLSTFFGKRRSEVKDEEQLSPVTQSVEDSEVEPLDLLSKGMGDDAIVESSFEELPFMQSLSMPSSSSSTLPAGPSSSRIGSQSESQTTPAVGDLAPKRKMQADSNYPAQKTKKIKQGGSSQKAKSGKQTGQSSQAKLSSFFSVPKARVPDPSPSSSSGEKDAIDVDAHSESEDLSFLSSISSPIIVPGSSQLGKSTTTWSQVFARIEPPRCSVHGEPTIELKVNKPGPNKGKAFFICSRPVGPGYDAGRERRLREEVDPQYRCNYFKWKSDVRRERAG